eukprot:tig00021035_g17234.t1
MEERGRLLWRPSEARMRESNMAAFIRFVNSRYGARLPALSYDDLYTWSVNNIDEFWAAVWEFTGIVSSRPYDRVRDGDAMPAGVSWFPGARLNFAENLLRHRDDGIAIVFAPEASTPAGAACERLTYRDLWRRVAALARALAAWGVRPGDRCAGIVANTPEAAVAMLATTAVGAVWSSCSPDFGARAVLDRLGQVAPRVLFASAEYRYKGKRISTRGTVEEVARGLPSLEKLVSLPYGSAGAGASEGGLPAGAEGYGAVLARHAAPEGYDEEDAIAFAQLPFDHPVFIMFTSGTTGLPKCMVQGPGVLLNHAKELVLHCDVRRADRLLYFTTAGWMMWNWALSALAAGATLVLYDGSPFHPGPLCLWELAARERVTVLGTSAKYLSALQASPALQPL